MELLTLALFCAALLLCILFDFSILYALAAGLVLFLLYGRRKGFTWRELGQMTLEGVKTVKNILITFLLIGMLTGLWRGSGTIAVIVCYAAELIKPSIFLLMAFLLNCLVSVLTGTAFGTSATMGVICATMASALGIDPMLLGGAVLSGAYFGDRCSPVSTSALLVAELTGTDIFTNIKRMLRSALVPFLLSCLVYAFWGFFTAHDGDIPDLKALFSREFQLHWLALLPALVILLLSLFRVKVKLAMTASILWAIPICLFVQHMPLSQLPLVMLRGYQATDTQVSAMLSGGGVTSMLKVAAIVCLSSSYSGIFQKTGLLDKIHEAICKLSGRATPYTATLITAIASCMIACNQTLTIMLTHQLCIGLGKDAGRFALDLEDSSVVIPPLVPWAIACAVTLSSVNAPNSSIFFACFLYLLPLWRLLTEAVKKRKKMTAF